LLPWPAVALAEAALARTALAEGAVFSCFCYNALMNVVTRFAPSPTGYFHAGSYRTALFAWIFAKQNAGKFILRIEDTDRERSKKEYEENIIDSLKWLGLDYDEFFRQSERAIIYKKYLESMIASGQAFISKETPKEAGDRAEVIRFKNPNKKVVFNDLIRGQIEFDTSELGDFVIAKSLDEPIFHLVNVIDDYEMGVTHVIRGEDHISNTPRHILIYEAIGATVPFFAHIPLLLSKDRSKLSKRNGAIPVTDYKSRGYLAGAIINYLALLGWHPADDREILSMNDIIKDFSLDRVQKGGAIFDDEKLTWFNRQYILKLNDHDFAEYAKPFLPEWLSGSSDMFKKMIPLLRDKVHTLSEISGYFSDGGELLFIKKLPSYEKKLLLWKKEPDPAITKSHLEYCKSVLEKIGEKEFHSENIRQAIWSYAEEKGKGNVLWPLRVALTGQEKSPDPVISAEILGKKESLSRINHAIAHV
jgi:glutamyl-tRNA synthetase